jgi:pilus assembly protein CpaF
MHAMIPPSPDPSVLDRVKRRIQADGEALTGSSHPREARVSRLRARVVEALCEEGVICSGEELQGMINRLIEEMIGLGPLEPLLRDADVSEIMINGPDRAYVEKSGRLEEVCLALKSTEHLLYLVEKIIGPLGLRVDESSPYVDARLLDGSRVNVIIPPLSLCGPVITVRKFARVPITIDTLMRRGLLSPEVGAFLAEAVSRRLNIIVSGGAGSGKTTLLNALSAFIPEGERIITIEDAAELQLQQGHVVPLEARPPNLEGKGAVTVRDLLRNSLRMRPDRIIIGEVRGGEALDMLQAMNTGHEGSLSTVHANSPLEALYRLETMACMADTGLPPASIASQITASIDLVMHVARGRDGTRRLLEVSGVDPGAAPGTPALRRVFHLLPPAAGQPATYRCDLDAVSLRELLLRRCADIAGRPGGGPE